MTKSMRYSTLFSSAVFALALSLTGCSDSGVATTDTTSVAEEHSDHEHGAWWCGEHGVPEEECAQCDKSLVADFKAKGDWCEEHNRPDSQCFIDHPENFDEFAALYEAKFGERPEMPTE